MNQQEINGRYDEIDLEWGSDGRNVYQCASGHNTLTIHESRGVTPMFMECKVCSSRSTSMMYSVSQEGTLINIRNTDPLPVDITERWIRPTKEQVWELQCRSQNWMVEHILNGGLILESELQALLN